MNLSVLVVTYLVTLFNVQLGHSQCDGKISTTENLTLDVHVQ